MQLGGMLGTRSRLLGKLGMDLGPRIVWDILFVTMILVGVAGNLMVLWIVTGKVFLELTHYIFIIYA